MKQEKSKYIFSLLLVFFCGCTMLHAQDPGRDPNDPVISQPEQAPEFRGGQAALMEFIKTYTLYPDSARLNGISGKVYVSFTILENGDVSDVKVLRGIGYGCDEEAARVIRFTNGNWIPGNFNGKPLKVKFNMPIKFSLN